MTASNAAPAQPEGQQTPAPQAQSDGFPAGTPVEQMTVDQQLAYHRHQAQRWQSRAEGNYAQLQDLGIKSPEDIAAVKDKIGRIDTLEYELSSDSDKRVADAEKTTSEKVRAQLMPALIGAKLETAAARAGVAEDDLASALQFVDRNLFLDKSGEIDTAKVNAYIGTLPAKGGSSQQPRGPLVTPHAPAGTAPVRPGDGARAALAERGIKIA